tara:strand:+ start:563 stop:1705 length:1143 start_codon:yes stop_codon:yes gene_type:complete
MAIFYVTPTGSDSNAGTSAGASMRTINAAIQAISSVSYGDGYDQNEVRVYSSASAAATYFGSHASYYANIINTSQGNKYGTTVIASGPYDVILDCSNKTRGAYLSYYSTIKGFYFTASNQSARTTDSTVEAAASSTQYRIEDCTFDACTDTDSVCIDPGGAASRNDRYDPWIKRCIFKNLDCTSAIYGSSNDVSVWESILIYDSTFDYQAVRYAGDSSDFGIVRHITIDGCTTGYDAIHSNRTQIVNCIVSNCAVHASYDFYSAINGGEIKNCLAYNNTTSSGSFFGTGDTTSSVITADPVYTDRTNKDFSLAPKSPGRGAGSGSADVVDGLYDISSGSFADPPALGCYRFILPPLPTEKFTIREALFTIKGGGFAMRKS